MPKKGNYTADSSRPANDAPDLAALDQACGLNLPGSFAWFDRDSAASYAGLTARFVHCAVDHATAYVLDKVHINGMENFWSLLKRMLHGTYVAVAPFHLFRYVDEEAWRFNNRLMTDGERFAFVMRGVLGKRLTYRYLCAIDDAGFMGVS